MSPNKNFSAPGLIGAVVLGCLLFLANPAHSQDKHEAGAEAQKAAVPPPGMLSSYEGQKVSSIEIAGRPDLDASAFAAQFVQKAGDPFSNERVNQSADAIKAAGKFDGVRIQVDPEADGVRVLFILEPAIYFGVFQFPGAEQFTYSRLVQVANYPIQTPFNAAEVERDRQSLLDFVRQQGFFQAEVRSEVKVDAPHGLANINFPVTLGRRAKFGNLDFVGIPAAEQEYLEHKLKTIIARARTVAIRPGKAYHRSTLTKATQYLQTEMAKQGLLGAEVKLAGAEYHADTNRADIHFNIVPGPNIRVDIQGAHIFGWTRKAILPVYQGVGVDDESVEEGRAALASYFQGKGFFDVKVDAHLETAKNHDAIVYRITKEKKHKVADVKVSGNKLVRDSELSPQLAVEEKHLFSAGKFSDQLMRKSVNNLKAVYQSEGFSDVAVVPSVTNRGGDISVSFRVTEGPRDIVSSLKVEGADTFPASQYAPNGLKLAVGQPYSQSHVQQDRTNIVANYLKAGYLTSSFRETATEVSKSDPHHIEVVYHIYEGPKVNTGEVLTLGRDQTRQRLIDEDVSDIKPGTPLTETELLTAGSKLYDHTGVFDWAEVDPKRQVTTQTQEDVLIKVHEARKNDFTYGFGFEVINRGGSIPSGTVALPNLPPVGLPSNFSTSQVTFYGPRGTVQYTRNNFRGKGESISVTGFGGRLDQRGAFYYIDPNFRWSHWRATTSFSAEHNEENPIFSSQQELGGFQLQRFLDKAQKKTLFLRYQFSQTNLTRVLIDALVPQADRNVRLSTLAANLTRDTRDNVLDEHKGVLQSLELDFNTTKLGSSVNFAKVNAQAAYYKQTFHNIVWANSVRIGLAQPYANSRVPLSEAFFTGGGNSLRGFPLDGAGPQRKVLICPNGATTCSNDEINVPAGGNELLIINSEARIPLPIKKGLGLVTFYDGGNVFPLVGFHRFTSLYANNVGLGLRYATPVGPVRVDLGYNINNQVQGVSSTQYFISIGQAF
ncbi:MAG TPA: POTRA domain-containing protein [Terracidiphilus sp.]